MITIIRHIQKKRKARQIQLPAGGDNNVQVGHQTQTSSGTELDATVGSQRGAEVKSSRGEVAKRRRWVNRWKVIFGLWGPFVLTALDTTIVASALPYIATDFDEIKQLNWIVSAFNLTSAAFLPFWAQMADIFGRYSIVQGAIVVLMIGSALCTGANIFSVLLLGRAVQGIGAAGVNISIRTVLADRVSLSDYAFNWTVFTLVSGVGFSCGPVIGGYLTQTSWRWCFAINLPVSVVAVGLVFVLLRKELLGPQPLPELEGRGVDTTTRRGRLLARLSTLDYGGQMLFLWGLGLVILALTWGGGTFAWTSPAVLAPLVIGGILSLGWILYEYSMAPGSVMARIFPYQRAMMPWELLSQRNISLLFFVTFTTGMALFAVFYFMDLYFVLVKGRSSSSAGISLLAYLWGAGPGGIIAMVSSNIWPRQTFPILLLGSVATAAGMAGLAWAVHAEDTNAALGMMALVGFGTMLRMNPSSLHCLAYFPAMTAQIACLQAFALPFGGLVGLTIMTTVFTNKSQDGDTRDAIVSAFIAMVPFMCLGVITTALLGNVWIMKDGTHDVVHGSYLWGFVTGKTLTRERITSGHDPVNPATGLEKKKTENDVEAGLEHPMEFSTPADE